MSDSNFNQKVYALVRRIPAGKVLTYSRVAALIGVPKGARAVGWALRALPKDTDVPWQRVINAQGQISTTNRLPETVIRQRELLEAEGVKFDESDHVKLEGKQGILWRVTPFEVELMTENMTG